MDRLVEVELRPDHMMYIHRRLGSVNTDGREMSSARLPGADRRLRETVLGEPALAEAECFSPAGDGKVVH